MRNSNFGIGVLHVKVIYRHIFFVASFLYSIKFLLFHRIEYPKRCQWNKIKIYGSVVVIPSKSNVPSLWPWPFIIMTSHTTSHHDVKRLSSSWCHTQHHIMTSHNYHHHHDVTHNITSWRLTTIIIMTSHNTSDNTRQVVNIVRLQLHAFAQWLSDLLMCSISALCLKQSSSDPYTCISIFSKIINMALREKILLPQIYGK